MYRFESSVRRQVLDKRYKVIYEHAGIQRKWDREVIRCPELAGTLPAGVLPETLLTMRYEKLVEVYLLYRQVYNQLPDDRKAALNDAASRVFTYGSYRGHIRRFLMDANNGFEIHNCVYCDLEDARAFGNGRRQFDTEHILDKGECPLVGLSLYNFCPACGTCNTICKGTRPIGNNEVQMKKLSPTSKQYDFEHKVKFVLTMRSEAVGKIKYDHPEWYEIDFNYQDDDYREVTRLFDLKNRYNLPHNKQDALEWREKAIKNRGIALGLAAVIHLRTIGQQREAIFHLEARRRAHSEKLKLMEDMIFG